MIKISNKIDDQERAFYGSKNTEFENVKIDGPADGESAFKECTNISISNSFFALRYPMWHNTLLKVKNLEMTETCRAALWYCDKVGLIDVKSKGIKALRECRDVSLKNCDFCSEEIFWRTKDISIVKSKIEGVYAFFQCKKINIKGLEFKGKYSFQYVKNVEILDSVLDTKDAFWHSENVVCRNCVIKGEYLGWYSKNLTLIDCKISGTQPLCYASNLKLVNCSFENCDLAFEYSSVKGTIKGDVLSIKNPLKGSIRMTGKTEYIKDGFDKSNNRFELIQENITNNI